MTFKTKTKTETVTLKTETKTKASGLKTKTETKTVTFTLKTGQDNEALEHGIVTNTRTLLPLANFKVAIAKWLILQ